MDSNLNLSLFEQFNFLETFENHIRLIKTDSLQFIYNFDRTESFKVLKFSDLTNLITIRNKHLAKTR